MTPVFIVAIVFGFVSLIVKMNLDFQREKMGRLPGAEAGLRTSELKALIREAVEEANRPLLDRLDDLEAQLESDRQLIASTPPRLLEGPDEPKS